MVYSPFFEKSPDIITSYQFHNFFLTIHLDIHKSSLQIDQCKFLHSCKVSLHSHLRLNVKATTEWQ